MLGTSAVSLGRGQERAAGRSARNSWDYSGYVDLLQQCGRRSDLAEGKFIHARIVAAGLDGSSFFADHLITMYGRCQCPQEARQVFDKIQNRAASSWSSMIAAYSRNGHLDQAIFLFRSMEWEGFVPDAATLVSVITACSDSKDLAAARSIYKLALETGFWSHIVVATSLVNMFGKCGQIQQSRQVFDSMPYKNIVSCNAMITAYAQAGLWNKALDLFQALIDDEGRHGQSKIRPNNVTFSSVLAACRSARRLQEARIIQSEIATHGLSGDVIVASMLIDTFARCGSLDDAIVAFEAIVRHASAPNLVCWTAMSGAYLELGHGSEALKLFHRMDLEGVEADAVAYVNALGACAAAGDLKQGRKIHARIASLGYCPQDHPNSDRSSKSTKSDGSRNEILDTALANMYSRCGSPREGLAAFARIARKDSISWNGMIAALARDGSEAGAIAAMATFHEMILDGATITAVSFLSVLHACSHKGMVERAWSYFTLMLEEEEEEERHSRASAKHYRCMADTLARAGRVSEAQELLGSMPLEPGIKAWKAVLSACRTHGEQECALSAARSALELEPGLPQTYVMLFNVCGGKV